MEEEKRIDEITYNELKNIVVTYIRNNCYNITDAKFNSLPAEFKAGYSRLVYNGANGTSDYTSHAYVSLTGNAVSKVPDTIEDNITAFLTNAGYTNLNVYITVPEFIAFFDNLISFCARYLKFATSQFSSESYLIYGDTSDTAKYTSVPDDIIYAKTMNDVISVLRDRISIAVRCYPVKYGFTFD